MKKLFISLIFVSLSSNVCFASAFGNYDAGAVNSQYMKDLRLHESIVRNKNNNAVISTKKIPETQEEVTSSSIKTIEFVNNSYISSKELSSVVSEYIDKPMSIENITAIRKDIMKYYQEKGYFSAIATVLSHNSQTGNVVFEVREGGINSIQIQN